MISLPLYLLSWGTWNLTTRNLTWCEWWGVLCSGWFHDQHLGQSHSTGQRQGVYAHQFTQYCICVNLEIKFPYFSKLIHLYLRVLLSMRLMCFWGKCLCVLEKILCFLVKGSPSWVDKCKCLLGSRRQPQEELLWKQRVRSVTITRKLWLTQRLFDQVTQHGIQHLAPEWKCTLENIIRASDVFLMCP